MLQVAIFLFVWFCLHHDCASSEEQYKQVSLMLEIRSMGQRYMGTLVKGLLRL